MVRGMTRRGDCLQAPSIASHEVAISKLEIGIEFAVPASIEAWLFIQVKLTGDAMRPLPVGWRARCGLDARCCGRVVAVSMSDQDVRDRLVPNGIEQRSDMHFVERTGIDDGDAITADDIADRSLEGERPWIV